MKGWTDTVRTKAPEATSRQKKNRASTSGRDKSLSEREAKCPRQPSLDFFIELVNDEASAHDMTQTTGNSLVYQMTFAPDWT